VTNRIVYFTGCFADYYDPDIGKSFIEVMEKNGFEVIVPDTKCCGMPQMANSNLRGAKKNFDFNVKALTKAAAPGYDILTTCPSCNMMLRKEGLPFFDSEEAQFVANRVYDACEFLLRLHKEGKLNTDFGEVQLRVFYHNPCHLKVQKLTAAVDLMKLIPGLQVVGVNTNCCGMGGSYGMKKQNFDRSQEIGQKVWNEVKAAKVDAVVTDCGGCGLQVQAGTGARIMHPMMVLNQAYKAFKVRKVA
jgi:glycerol-3-phosphate dehydrogenase subunit C